MNCTYDGFIYELFSHRLNSGNFHIALDKKAKRKDIDLDNSYNPSLILNKKIRRLRHYMNKWYRVLRADDNVKYEI